MKDLAQLVPFVVIAALFWLLLIRPAQRRSREMQRTQGAAEVGSEVMLTSGIFGSVVDTGEGTLQVEIAPGTTIKVARQAVARVLTEPDGFEDEQDEQLDDDLDSDVDDDLDEASLPESHETAPEATALGKPRSSEH